MLVPAAGGPQWLVVTLLLIAEFFSSLGVMVLDVNGNSLGAALTPDRIRGRVLGAHRVVNYGVRPIGSFLAGVLASWIGIRTTLWISSIGAALGILWLLPSPVPAVHVAARACRMTEPLERFHEWVEGDVMALATASPDGRPSSGWCC